MATTTHENIAASRRLLEESFGNGKLDVIDELCADGYIDHDPIMGDRGRDGVRDTVAGYRAAFPDLTFAVEDAFAADDKVVLRWKAHGTFEHEFMGQQPTGEKGDPVCRDRRQPLRGRQRRRVLDAVGHAAVHEEHRSHARGGGSPGRGLAGQRNWRAGRPG